MPKADGSRAGRVWSMAACTDSENRRAAFISRKLGLLAKPACGTRCTTGNACSRWNIPAVGVMSDAPKGSLWLRGCWRMFDPSTLHPRVFAVPPGTDFPKAHWLPGCGSAASGPPEALARVAIGGLNTRRMARRVRDLFDQGPPCLSAQAFVWSPIWAKALIWHRFRPPYHPLRRRLELTQLVSQNC